MHCMHSNQREVDFQHVIQTANDLACSLRESRVRLKQSLGSLKTQKIIAEKALVTYDNGPEKSKGFWRFTACVAEANQGIKTTNICLDCPNCWTKLGVNVSSDSHSQLFQLKDPLRTFITPDEKGDNDKSGDENKEQTKSYSSLNSCTFPNNNIMSYTVLKGCTSSPATTAYHVRDKTCPIPVKYKNSKSQVIKKSIGKGTISFQQAGFTYRHSPTHTGQRQQRNPCILGRSHSFTVAPRTGVLQNTVQTSEVTMPPSLQTLGNHAFENMLNEDVLIAGIDKVDIPVSLYDSTSSSSTTSCSTCDPCDKALCNCDNDNAGSFEMSHDTPRPESSLKEQPVIQLLSASPKIVSNNLDHQTSTTGLCPENETIQPSSTEKENIVYKADHQTSTTTLWPVEHDVWKQDIPEFRQDLYKDCLTLFAEKWFGKCKE